ncbi:retrovirus-related pol polyprotein from transposon TNT 1-94 [Tanacetum coccineum]
MLVLVVMQYRMSKIRLFLANNRYNAVKNVENRVVQNEIQYPGVPNVRNQNCLIVVPGIANQNVNQNGNGNVVTARAEGNGNRNNEYQILCYRCRGMGHLARNCTVKPRRRDVAYLQSQLLIAQKEETGIQIQAKEFDLIAATGDLDEIEEVNTNYILMANLQLGMLKAYDMKSKASHKFRLEVPRNSPLWK